ncbi:MAG: type 1 glutamine amidotransferase family protein [Negativicutes bacterium]|jgi:putative intracellular protease/amidase
MKVYLYLLDTLADWEIGFITAELNSNRFLDKTKEAISIIKIGNTTEAIRTMGGISISPDECIDNIQFNEGDLLILPGADTWMDDNNQEIMAIISDLIERKVIIAAICGATIALAKKGLLNNRRHTSNDKDYLKMVCPEYSGDAYYLNEPVVVDDNLITATGLAPLEFSYEIFKKISAMKANTLEAWYQLYKTKDAKYYFGLVESLI